MMNNSQPAQTATDLFNILIHKKNEWKNDIDETYDPFTLKELLELSVKNERYDVLDFLLQQKVFQHNIHVHNLMGYCLSAPIENRLKMVQYIFNHINAEEYSINEWTRTACVREQPSIVDFFLSKKEWSSQEYGDLLIASSGSDVELLQKFIPHAAKSAFQKAMLSAIMKSNVPNIQALIPYANFDENQHSYLDLSMKTLYRSGEIINLIAPLCDLKEWSNKALLTAANEANEVSARAFVDYYQGEPGEEQGKIIFEIMRQEWKEIAHIILPKVDSKSCLDYLKQMSSLQKMHWDPEIVATLQSRSEREELKEETLLSVRTKKGLRL